MYLSTIQRIVSELGRREEDDHAFEVVIGYIERNIEYYRALDKIKMNKVFAMMLENIRKKEQNDLKQKGVERIERVV